MTSFIRKLINNSKGFVSSGRGRNWQDDDTHWLRSYGSFIIVRMQYLKIFNELMISRAIYVYVICVDKTSATLPEKHLITTSLVDNKLFCRSPTTLLLKFSFP